MKISDVDADITSLLYSPALTRRTILLTSLAAGFAAAVRPVTAATITTDAQELMAGEVKIPVADGQIPAYRAMPAVGGHFPVILVVHEIFGVHEYIKDVCRRLAKLGYFAVAPAFYAREGDVSTLDMKDIMPIVQKVPDAQVMSDLDAAVAWAKTTGKADTGRLGITGFCWGGRIVWLYAAHNAQLRAGVAWYGRLIGTPTELQPKYPVDVAADLKAPVLGLYGGKDESISAENIEQMRTALKRAKVATEIIVYPEAPHGFHADYRPSYNEQAAQDGWSKLQGWFGKYGVAPR